LVPSELSPLWAIIKIENATFAIEYSWLLYNPNYFSVSLLNFTVQLSWSFQPQTQTPFFYVNKTTALIPARTELRIKQQMTVQFIDDMGFMWWYCDANYSFTTTFQAVATVSVMGLITPDIVQTFQKTNCYYPQERFRLENQTSLKT